MLVYIYISLNIISLSHDSCSLAHFNCIMFCFLCISVGFPLALLCVNPILFSRFLKFLSLPIVFNFLTLLLISFVVYELDIFLTTTFLLYLHRILDAGNREPTFFIALHWGSRGYSPSRNIKLTGLWHQSKRVQTPVAQFILISD